MEVVGRQTKVVAAVEAVPDQKMAAGFSMMSDRFELGGGLLVDQCRFGCSRSRLTGSAVLRMR